MKKQPSKAETRSLRRFVTDPDLIGWIWPWEYKRVIQNLRERDSEWFEKNQHRILPPIPVQRFEKLRVELEAEHSLLV